MVLGFFYQGLKSWLVVDINEVCSSLTLLGVVVHSLSLSRGSESSDAASCEKDKKL